MNSNEIDELIEHLESKFSFDGGDNMGLQAAKMLRKYKHEILILKQIIDANNLSQNIGQFVKPTNEPVAWMFRGYLYEKDPSGWTVHEHPDVPVIPLYTHPVKELTDKEIFDVWFKNGWESANNNELVDFARAILRKASETTYLTNVQLKNGESHL